MGLDIFKILLLLSICQCALCQVCEENRSVLREVPETFRFSFIETYEEPCIFFCAVKTRKSVNVTTRIVQRYDNVTISVCCDGYEEDTDHEGNGLYCKPICSPPCENGFCRKPNQCACDPGYALDPLNPHVCKPLCLEGCTIPHCIATLNPQCSSNTSSKLERQKPYCAEPCVNGVCLESGICQCLPGYRAASSPFICEVDLPGNNSCEHGHFVPPNTCLCDVGWEWKCGACQPVCAECDHGTCVSPGECKCDDGYVVSDNGKCEPNCINGCTNGKCISPDKCSCDPGWYKTTDNGECAPHCDMNCNHGDCIAPNICACHVGYQLYINSKGRSRCLVNRKNCTDSSSDPKTCECHAPYQVSYFKDDGSNCLCVGACANESTRCTNATCLFMNAPPNPDEAELDYDYLIDSDEEDYEDSSKTTTVDNEKEDNDDKDFTPTESNYGNLDMLMTLLPTFRGDESIKQISKDMQTSSSGNKEINESLESTETVSNTETIRKKREAVNLPYHWIFGSVIIGAIIVLIILGFFAKRKCCKTQLISARGNSV